MSLGNFYTAIVVEYFSSPVPPGELQAFSDKYSNLKIPILRSQRLLGMPAGSVLAKIVDSPHNDLMVFYPFFPHMKTPVKAGEQIIVLYGTPYQDRIGYWLTRKITDFIAEDVNYTHNDRSNFTAGSISQDAALQIARDFPDNGMAAISYATITQNSDTYNQTFQGEVVPRYYPKSPDTSIQGSNNTLIVLGSNTTLGKEKDTAAGMIDIVAGRGQSDATKPITTYTNSRGYDEVDKTSTRNTAEGDLDFDNDLSRINISMGLNVDSDFSIEVGDNSGTAPAIVLKTDQIRLLARQDLKIVVGSGSSQSSILIKNDGNIVITPGAQIKLSGESDDQAYLRYDEFNKIINSILEILGALQTGLTATNVYVDTVATSAGSPAPSLSLNTGEIGNSTSDILLSLESIKSKKILGS